MAKVRTVFVGVYTQQTKYAQIVGKIDGNRFRLLNLILVYKLLPIDSII